MKGLIAALLCAVLATSGACTIVLPGGGHWIAKSAQKRRYERCSELPGRRRCAKPKGLPLWGRLTLMGVGLAIDGVIIYVSCYAGDNSCEGHSSGVP